jgi:outer membrane protein insertion porin family
VSAALFGALIGCLLTALPAGAQPLVTQIIVSNLGPAAASSSLVRANIRAKEGEPYNRAVVDNDVRTLYGTGYFYNIRVVEERSADGVTLTYLLQGKPKLGEIRFSGNKKLSTDKLRKKVTSKVGEPLDERKLFNDVQEMKKLYQSKGYQQTQVKYVPVIDDREGRGTVTFEIQEQPKIRVIDVVFDGAGAFSQKKLRRQIKTRRHWMFSWLTGSGKLKDEQLEEDKDKLTEFYFDAGYIDFELKEVKHVTPEPGRLVLHFVVSEGKQYKVGAVQFKGQRLYTTNTLGRAVKMQPGTTFTPKGLMKDSETLQDLYGLKGYIDSRILPRKRPNTQTGAMDLTYEIEEGDKSYIEKIEIRGNLKTKDRVIRRELSVAPGEVFDMVRVKRSKQRLEGTALFERVDTQPEPTEVPDRKNLVVTVAEGTTGHLSVGAGFSSIDSIVGFAEYRESNFQLPWFRGGGQKFRLRAALGNLRREVDLGFVEPWFFGRKIWYYADFYTRQLDYVSVEQLFNETRTGVRTGFRKALGSDFYVGGISYTLENVGIVDVDDGAPATIQRDEGHTLISKAGLSFTMDRRRYDTAYSGFVPMGGHEIELRGELAGGPFGADADYYRLLLTAKWYFKGLFKGHVLEVGGRAGVEGEYGNSDHVPFFDHFFLGGLDSLRGFQYRDVGPREIGTGLGADAERVGGETAWFATVEYSLPVIAFLRLAVFYDIGMVYPDSWSFKEGTINGTGAFNGTEKTGFYNDNWGIGVRLNIPRLGPLRLDYGIPITSDSDNDSGGRFQFSVGYTRDY